MDRPFNEIHEIYRILYLRSEAQKKAEEEREKNERKNKQPTRQKTLTDVNNIPEPSPLEIEAMEDALEDMM
jgi:hypothetical protein